MEVFLASPWVPAEWITAHGLKPRGIWFEPGLEKGAGQASAGVCAFARNVLQFAQASRSTTVFSTQCDQLRRAYDEAAEMADNRAPTSSRVFLFNLPATWQTPAAEKMVR